MEINSTPVALYADKSNRKEIIKCIKSIKNDYIVVNGTKNSSITLYISSIPVLKIEEIKNGISILLYYTENGETHGVVRKNKNTKKAIIKVLKKNRFFRHRKDT